MILDLNLIYLCRQVNSGHYQKTVNLKSVSKKYFSFNFSIGLTQSDWIKVSNYIFLGIKYTTSLLIKIINLLILSINKMLPAVGQGALAIQIRKKR